MDKRCGTCGRWKPPVKRKAYGFEIKKNFVKDFNEIMAPLVAPIESATKGLYPTLWELAN